MTMYILMIVYGHPGLEFCEYFVFQKEKPYHATLILSVIILGGPRADRDPFEEANWLNDESQCQEAIALMKHAVVKQKMRLTLIYRQKVLHDPDKSSDILAIFPTVHGHTRHGMSTLFFFFYILM